MVGFLSDQTVDLAIEDNHVQRHPVEDCLPQGSLVSLILFGIHTSGLTEWVDEWVSGVEGQPFLYNFGWVVTATDIYQSIRKLASWDELSTGPNDGS